MDKALLTPPRSFSLGSAGEGSRWIRRCSPNPDPSPPEAREKGLDGQALLTQPRSFSPGSAGEGSRWTRRCSPHRDPSPSEAREKGLDGQGAAHPTEILLPRKRGRRVSMDKALLTQPRSFSPGSEIGRAHV